MADLSGYFEGGCWEEPRCNPADTDKELLERLRGVVNV